MAVTAAGKPLADTALFKPLKLGNLNLAHRVALAPLTRMRHKKNEEGINLAYELNVEYYQQRASQGGFLLTEATDISRYASGYPGVPGIYSPAQIQAWKKVTDAVHAKGGYLFCQIWHVGRAATPGLLGGRQTISSSDIPISGAALDGTNYADAPPRPMTVEEIHETTKDFAQAAKNAVEAGFDGVEIHAANGYLLEQFLHDNVNKRTDHYGGSVENRCRFPLEVLKAVTEAIGAEKVGIRLSPYNYFQDTKDSNPNAHWAYLCQQLVDLPQENRPVYVHMVEPRFDEVLDEQAKLDALSAYTNQANAPEGDASATPKGAPNTLVPFRRIVQKGDIKFFAAGAFNRDNAAEKVESGDADVIVFGRWFIANPDLPWRLKEGLPLNPYDRSTFYGADPPSKGYIDYPFYKE